MSTNYKTRKPCKKFLMCHFHVFKNSLQTFQMESGNCPLAVKQNTRSWMMTFSLPCQILYAVCLFSDA